MGDIPTDGFALVVDPNTGEVQETEIEENKPISQDQRQSLFKVAKEHFGKEANDVLKALLAEQGYESTDGMPVSAFNLIMSRLVDLAQERKDNPPEQAPQEAEPVTGAEPSNPAE